ncbi:12056_t:CDS:2, partial [Racocetra persica]
WSCDQMIKHIVEGGREKCVSGTPVKYSEVYKDCWKAVSDDRPRCFNVLKRLEEVDTNDIILDDLAERCQASSEFNESTSID